MTMRINVRPMPRDPDRVRNRTALRLCRAPSRPAAGVPAPAQDHPLSCTNINYTVDGQRCHSASMPHARRGVIDRAGGRCGPAGGCLEPAGGRPEAGRYRTVCVGTS